ncbi:MAG: iron ABC transporter substrate-binding protein, partial [Candidatus Krumholzibacteriota bacterium]|nr:iron ABC transporter substrate-binding protein [Candidatus Krumholzibacteriota bacterium]
MNGKLSFIAVTCVALSMIAGAAPADELVVYSGRSKSLVAPVLKLFEKETGVRVSIKYGNTAQLALALEEEGDRSRADVFWAQDAGALGAVMKAGLFAKLPEGIETKPAEMFRQDGGMWVATSGRARVLAYSTDRVSEDALPGSINELSGPEYRGRVGWAPANASFQSFVTAFRRIEGEEAAEQWLIAMKENGAKAYPKNTAIIQAIVAGEVDYGLPNHYYLLRFKKGNKDFPVAQRFFAPRDCGNLINVAGIGILRTSRNRPAAEQFVRFLLSPTAQQYFTSDVLEYPVVDGVIPNSNLVDGGKL